MQPGEIKYNVKGEHIVRGGNFIIRGTIATSLRKIDSTLYIELFFLNTVSKTLSVGVKKLRKDKNRTRHLFLLLVVTAVFSWSVIKLAGFLIWIVGVSPSVMGLIIALATYKKFSLSTLSYIIITILSIMMFAGGHYTYSKIPLFNWLKDIFHVNRNHYDRFGHFLKGLFIIVIREILLRKTSITKGYWSSLQVFHLRSPPCMKSSNGYLLK